MIGIIDYGVGNIRAFLNIYNKLSVPVKIVRTAAEFQDITKLILPGVGSFDYAMQRLDESGMRTIIDEMVLSKEVPVLGVCVGMQMLANDSEEGRLPGLKWINASVRKFDADKIPFVTHLPHMGWNDISPLPNHNLFKGLENRSQFYFLHSYYFETYQNDSQIATSNYGIDFCCAVNYKNIYGVQFHPEKSHQFGITLLNNFAKI